MTALLQMNSTHSLKCVLFRENNSFLGNRIWLSFQSYTDSTLSSQLHIPLPFTRTYPHSHIYTDLSDRFCLLLYSIVFVFLNCGCHTNGFTFCEVLDIIPKNVFVHPMLHRDRHCGITAMYKMKTVMISSLFGTLFFTDCQRHLLLFTLHVLFLPAL